MDAGVSATHPAPHNPGSSGAPCPTPPKPSKAPGKTTDLQQPPTGSPFDVASSSSAGQSGWSSSPSRSSSSWSSGSRPSNSGSNRSQTRPSAPSRPSSGGEAPGAAAVQEVVAVHPDAEWTMIRFFTRAFVATAFVAAMPSMALPRTKPTCFVTDGLPPGQQQNHGHGWGVRALGADLGSMGINPAGLGLYRRGDLAITTGLNSANTDASWNTTRPPRPNSRAPQATWGWPSPTPAWTPIGRFSRWRWAASAHALQPAHLHRRGAF